MEKLNKNWVDKRKCKRPKNKEEKNLYLIQTEGTRMTHKQIVKGKEDRNVDKRQTEQTAEYATEKRKRERVEMKLFEKCCTSWFWNWEKENYPTKERRKKKRVDDTHTVAHELVVWMRKWRKRNDQPKNKLELKEEQMNSERREGEWERENKRQWMKK